MEYILKTTNLTKKYKNEYAVKDLTLRIPKGSVYGFLGPNGSGKTTTMKMILGLIHSTSGNIEVLGQTLNNKNRLPILASIGSIIESPSYYGHLTARENLEITCILRNISKVQIESVLQMVGLDHTGKKPVSKFSLGMKQRLGIANALIGKPKILLLDEPTNGLDPQGIVEIRELIKELPKRYGMTVFISSHLLSEIEQMADYISIISKGDVKFQGSMQELKSLDDRHIRLSTTDNEKALQLFHNLTLDSTFFRLPMIPNDELIAVIKLLAKHDIYTTRIIESAISLEDIFLNMTRLDKKQEVL